MATGADLAQLEARIGYTFRDKQLLSTAVTHSSYANESKSKGTVLLSNERFEFLGDEVLGLLISHYLFEQYPSDGEGILTKMRQQLVCESTLARIARSISLGDYLLIGKGDEMIGTRYRSSILADAMEALIAAVYLDSDWESSRHLLLSLFQDELDGSLHLKKGDYKTRLQQLVQQDGIEELTYRVIAEHGPEHNKEFEVEAYINSNIVGRGQGKSKRDAEQEAAREALLLFGIREERYH